MTLKAIVKWILPEWKYFGLEEGGKYVQDHPTCEYINDLPYDEMLYKNRFWFIKTKNWFSK